MRSSSPMSLKVVTLLCLVGGGRVEAQSVCRPAPAGLDPRSLLARSDSVMGVGGAGGRVLHWQGMQGTQQDYQSDRTYPPFFLSFEEEEGWYDPSTDALRSRGKVWFIDFGPAPVPELLSSATAVWARRDSTDVAVPMMLDVTARQRAMQPWTVIRAWRRDPGVRVEGSCVYRDYPRLVLTRTVDGEAERLFLDLKTGFPVGLARTEPHYLWGPRKVEYVWSNWQDFDGAIIPGSSFQVVDGEMVHTRSVASAGFLPADSAPSLRIPDPTLVQRAAPLPFLDPAFPDTVRIGATTFLLKNRGYTHAVTLQRDTVFLLDATQGEARSRADSTWIARLFPGPHPVVLVVTDLAWPHIAGVRFWVARGAIVASHPAAGAFLRRVVGRRWSGAPDALEAARRAGRPPRWRFRPIEGTTRLGGGELVLAPIDGITSEIALLGWIPSEGFLWASDYIQNVRARTEYATEVRAATARNGFAPRRVAAQHLPLTPWSTIDALYPAP